MKHNCFETIKCILLISSLVFQNQAFSQTEELISITAEATSQLASAADAAREIQQKTVAATARDQVLELIGEKRYQKSRALAEGRLVREANKFIPFVQPGEPRKQPDGTWKMKVEMRLSLASLKKMIIDAGLLSDSDTPVAMLPMIVYTDRIRSTSLRWWLESGATSTSSDTAQEQKKTLTELKLILESAIHKELMKQGFHLILPIDGLVSPPFPTVLRTDRPVGSDLKALGEYFSVSMVLRGDVRVRQAEIPAGRDGPINQWGIQVKLEVVPVSGGRTVAEIVRTYTTDSGPMDLALKRKLEKESTEISKDLANQVFDAWTKGTLAATTYRLAVRGALSPRQMTEFKSQLMKAVREVKSIRERLFEPGRTIFEIDFAATSEQFRDQLKSLELPGFLDRYVADTTNGEADGLTIPFTIELKAKTL